jgi:hypothetical protein
LRHLFVLGALVIGQVACSTATEPTRRVVGLIYVGESAPPTIIAPDTVRVGEVFSAIVNSFGSSSCTIPDGVDLTLGSSEAIIRPYDRVPNVKTICTLDLSPRPHPVELSFSLEGVANIVAVGEVIDDAAQLRVPGTVSKQIVVRQ